MKTLSMDQVVSEQLTVIDGSVYDLRRFAKVHRGGSPSIVALQGTDATERFFSAHGTDPKIRQMLARLQVGVLKDKGMAHRHPEDQRMAALFAQFLNEGLFHYKPSWLVWELLLILVPFALGIHALSLQTDLALPLSLLLLSIATLHHTYFAHDVRHDAVFQDPARGRHTIDLLGALIFGSSLNPQADEHRHHHAFTNQLELDGALRIRPLVWHRRMLRGHCRRLLKLQAPLFLVGLLPLCYPYMALSGLVYLVQKKRYGILAIVLLRFLLLSFYGWMTLPSYGSLLCFLFLPQILVSCFQGFVSSLNHFHLKMALGPECSQARSMIERTQNTGTGAIWTWLCGSLNFHIEHHLFPTMPRRNYPKIASRIQAYCHEFGVRYHLCNKGQALTNLVEKLRHPLGPIGPLPAKLASVSFET